MGRAVREKALRFGGISAPGNVRYATIDFETSSLKAVLPQAGLDLAKPAFLSWLGVTNYPTRAAVEKTLAVVAAMASLIVDVLSVPDRHNENEEDVVLNLA